MASNARIEQTKKRLHQKLRKLTLDADALFGEIDERRWMTSDSEKLMDRITNDLSKLKVYINQITVESTTPSLKDLIPEEYKLGYYRLGNGTTIANRAVTDPDTRDYENIAHVSDDGSISWYNKKLPAKVKREVEKFAKDMADKRLKGPSRFRYE